MRRTIAALAVATALVLIPAAAASAGKPSGGGGGGGKPSGGSATLSLVMVDPTDTVVSHGDVITFTFSPVATDRPFVSVMCSQNGALVYSASAGYFPSYPWSRDFVLSSMSWTGGAADCTARLYSTRDGIRTTTLATLAFHASA